MTAPQLNINLTINIPSVQELPEALRHIKEILHSDDMHEFGHPFAQQPRLEAKAAVAVAEPQSGAIPRRMGTAYRQVTMEYQRQLAEGTIPDQGWSNVKDWPAVFSALPSESRKVVQRAIENGGHISRAEVYEVLSRSEEQSLKGFTRPVTKLMEVLKNKGQIRDDAEPLLQPIYETSKTYQQAQGFKMPVQVISLIK